MTTAKKAGLDLLREPFPAHQISKLPKETKAQREKREANMALGIRCQLCGGWHHKEAVHLDYVGHAALTDRLLDCDAYWQWEPLAFTPDGLPAMDKIGGMWIKLTVCDQTRLGYGHAEGKSGGDAIKEVIGDALRNAAMRFGAALDLWHKGDLHGDDDDKPEAATTSDALRDAWRDGVEDSLPPNATPRQKAEAYAKAVAADFQTVKTLPTLDGRWDRHIKIIDGLRERFSDLADMVADAYETRKMSIEEAKK